MGEAVTDPPGYHVLGELGRGGMGVVYKARSLEHERIVALKMILSGRGADPLELARFRIEAEAIASLSHPNVVLIHEVGVHLGFPFFVLEYAEGGSLADRLRSQAVPCDWAARVTLGLALAMRHAHDRGVVHRDLKPANVLLMPGDTPKVTDFGLARFTTGGRQDDLDQGMTVPLTEDFREATRLRTDYERGSRAAGGGSNATFEDYLVLTQWERRMGSPGPGDERALSEIGRFLREALRQSSPATPEVSQAVARLTRVGTVMGTPQYMAPEQAWGEVGEVGRAADVYSLGAVLYHMLAGRPPFSGDVSRVLWDVREKPPVPPRQVRGSADPALEAICLRCLEKSPGRRYESMEVLADDLRAFLDGSGVAALGNRRLDGGVVGPAFGVGVGGDTPQDGDETRTWVPEGTTEPAPSGRKSWWRFWR
jgi:serine/threonine protein kinase